MFFVQNLFMKVFLHHNIIILSSLFELFVPIFVDLILFCFFAVYKELNYQIFKSDFPSPTTINDIKKYINAILYTCTIITPKGFSQVKNNILTNFGILSFFLNYTGLQNESHNFLSGI